VIALYGILVMPAVCAGSSGRRQSHPLMIDTSGIEQILIYTSDHEVHPMRHGSVAFDVLVPVCTSLPSREMKLLDMIQC
jgi:hypothetical protein